MKCFTDEDVDGQGVSLTVQDEIYMRSSIRPYPRLQDSAFPVCRVDSPVISGVIGFTDVDFSHATERYHRLPPLPVERRTPTRFLLLMRARTLSYHSRVCGIRGPHGFRFSTRLSIECFTCSLHLGGGIR